MRALAITSIGGLTLLALGCGSSAGTARGDADAAGASGGGAGGATGEGGSGATGAAGAGGGSCSTQFTACGGSLVGSWAADEKCQPPWLVEFQGNCDGETSDFTKVSSQKSWMFGANGSFTYTLSASGPGTIVFPDACLPMESPPLSCADASVGATYQHRVEFPGGAPGPLHCQDANSTCTCALSLAAAPMNLAGTYATTATTLTVSPAQGPTIFDYCVAGTTLKLRVHNADGSLGVTLLYDKQ